MQTTTRAATLSDHTVAGLRTAGLHPLFGAEIILDKQAAPSAALAAKIAPVLDDAGMVLIRNLKFDGEDLPGFASHFGSLANMTGRTSGIFRITNLDESGRMLPENEPSRARHDTNKLWHTDNSFTSPGVTYSFLLAHILPATGRDTLFCDGRVAWEVLDDDRQRQLLPLIAHHRFSHSLRLAGLELPGHDWSAVARKLVRHHKPSGRDALVIPSHVERIDGLDDERSRALIKELTQIASAPGRVYRHKWQAGDLLIWDNRCMLHRVSRINVVEQPRELHSCRVLDADDNGLV